MTSSDQSSSTPINAPPATNPQSAASGSTSYANATKGAATGSQAKVGGLASSQHAPGNSQPPVNGRPSAPSNAPTGPAIVSSTNGASDHSRTPSVTISAQGGAGFAPNGVASGPAGRPNISFGSIGASPSPSMSHSTPHMHNNSLSQPYGAMIPARSPSPIPPPMASSGGRPPSTLAGQGAVNFGSLQGSDGSDQSLPLRPQMTGIPSGPAQGQHLRRESTPNPPNGNNTFVPAGRGAGNRQQFPNQQFNASAQNSPHMFRQNLTMNQRQPSHGGSPFHQQQMPGRGGPGSPFLANARPQTNSSPMAPNAQLHMNGNVPYPSYGHMQPTTNMYAGMPDQYGPPYFAGYPNNAYMQPGMQMPPMFQSPQTMGPGPHQQQGFRAHTPYTPAMYTPAPAQMSRQSSQSGDPRPTSSMGAPSPAPQVGATPSPGPQASTFTRPVKKTSAIVIKNADGEVVDFKSKLQSPATATAPVIKPSGPAVVSSGGTTATSSTPPRTATPASQHSRSESVSIKPEMTEEERKRKFQEDFKRQVAESKGEPKPAEEKTEPAPVKVEDKPAEPKEEAKAEPAGETEEERKKREEEEEFERMVAEMEAKEKEEEEREAKFAAKKKAEQEEKKRKEAEAAANADEEMRRLEREAEEREEAKAKGKTAEDSDSEAALLFSKLKKNTQFGPQGETTEDSGASTPVSESPMPPPAQPASAGKPIPPLGNKQKPAALKLETAKPVEPAQPTAGMMSLKSARFLQVKNDAINYPEGIKSPNPSLNQNTRGIGQRYDNGFLLQFREVFKEKPSVDWDKILKDTVGDGSSSAHPGSASTPRMAGGRSMSSRGGAPMGAMGSFGAGGRTLPPGTSSEQRFNASSIPAGRGGPFGQFPGGRPGGFPMGGPGMARTPSSTSMVGMNSPRNASQRGKGSRRGGPTPQQEAELRKKMPLTAGMDLAPLEVSQTGWKPTNIGAAPQQILPGTHLAPDMVQRKVKASLNKMTPEKFDKIANDILIIASQSKDESDGRTLRQVIQLTFEKACDEAHWASMYAQFCQRMLQDMGPEIRDENIKDKLGNVVVGGALFRKYLLNRCQEEFERGWEVNLPEVKEGQDEAAMLSDEYYIAAAAKRRGLGLIQFIGELYKLGMLTLRIMHECVVKLLNFEGTPDEAAIESLVKLLRTIGGTMDADPKGHSMVDTYMDRVQTVMNMEGLPSRMYYMLLDTIDMRKDQWRSKDKLKGPKTIAEIRDEAAAQQAAADLERQRRPGPRPPMGRGDTRNFSGGGMPAPDYPRNHVQMDDLKKLTRNAGSRTSTSTGGGLGPNSLLSNSRSGSRRGGLGPRVGDDSNASSRMGTPPAKPEKESAVHRNAYDALAALEGDHPDDIASPPSQHASPAPAKAVPAEAGEADAGKSS